MNREEIFNILSSVNLIKDDQSISDLVITPFILKFCQILKDNPEVVEQLKTIENLFIENINIKDLINIKDNVVPRPSPANIINESIKFISSIEKPLRKELEHFRNFKEDGDYRKFEKPNKRRNLSLR